MKMGAASSKLKVREEIGRGAYGTVHKGVYEGKPVAIKKIHRLLLDYAQDDPEAFQRISSEFERECDLLKTLNCPNVVQLVGVFEIGGERMLVMELLHEMLASALKRMKGKGGLTEREAGQISYDIASGLNFLHTHNPPVVHRDLNAKNVLLTEDGTAKISDLGVSKFRPTDLGFLSAKAPGCLPYMPPEALGKDPKYTEKLDMFSFGVLMLQVVTGEDPNPALQNIGVVPEVERRKDHIELVPSDHVLRKCMMQCLEDDPSKRPTAQTVLMHCSEFTLKVREEIGRGAYGTVHKGVYEGKPVAVKKIHRLLLDYALDDPEAFQRILSEFEGECSLLKTFKCPNVVQFIGVFKIGGERMLVMELLHETLASALKRKKGKGGLTEREAGQISYDIASGLNFLHTHNPPVVHRDLNAKNVLLTEDGTAKISDLGVSKFRPTDLGFLSAKAPGCLPYMPPEALGKDPKYTEKLDMFSFGVLMLQMVTGEDPNPSLHGIRVVPEVERRKDHIELVPRGHVLKKCMLQCLEDDPRMRPTAKKILLLCSAFYTAPRGASSPAVKVCCIHGINAGSTSLVARYETGCFVDTQPTIGAVLSKCRYAAVNVMLFDLTGYERCRYLSTLHSHNSDGLVVVVDVTNMHSLEDARLWKEAADKGNPKSPPLPAILLANKCDLVSHRKVSPEDLAALAEELNCFTYMEVSAKTGQNVKEAFNMLFDKILGTI